MMVFGTSIKMFNKKVSVSFNHFVVVYFSALPATEAAGSLWFNQIKAVVKSTGHSSEET